MKNIVLPSREVKLNVYGKCKYDYTDGNEMSADTHYATYNDVVTYQVARIADEEIYDMGFDDVDPYEEYLILDFKNGETATFRNSFVDMFIMI